MSRRRRLHEAEERRLRSRLLFDRNASTFRLSLRELFSSSTSQVRVDEHKLGGERLADVRVPSISGGVGSLLGAVPCAYDLFIHAIALEPGEKAAERRISADRLRAIATFVHVLPGAI